MAHIDENALLKALQERMLADIARRQEAQSAVFNNYGYGGGASAPTSGGMGGLAAAMQGGSPVSDPSDDDYLVDILKENIMDPETGKATGWTKQVRRHKEKKGGEPHHPKKARSDEY